MQLAFSSVSSLGIHISPVFGELDRLQSSPEENAVAIKNKQVELGNIFKAGPLQCAVVFIPAGLFLLVSDQILNKLNQSPEVTELASNFLKIFALSAPPLALRACIGQIMYVNADAKPAMYIGVTNLAFATILGIWRSKGGLGINPQGITSDFFNIGGIFYA
jgi:peptidoglycan biosynthesis protein MviN/MurJ (putative lipid II flippase)